MNTTLETPETTLFPLAGVHIVKGVPSEPDYSTVPPSIIDNWSKAQSVQFSSFIYIIYNGGSWREHNLDDLFRMLEEYSLDPEYAWWILNPCEGVRDPEATTYETRWINGPRFYESEVHSFDGRFVQCAYGFSIHTNYQPLIDLLKTKMAENLACPLRYYTDDEDAKRCAMWKIERPKTDRVAITVSNIDLSLFD